MIIEMWTPELEPIPGGKVLIVRQSDLQDFDVVSSEFKNYTIHIINQDSPHFSMAFAFLALSNGISLGDIESLSFVDSNDVAVAKLAETVVGDIGKNALDEARIYLSKIAELNERDKYDRLINSLEILIETNIIYRTDIVAASVCGSVTRKAWWLEKPYLLEVLASAKKDIANLSLPLSTKLLAYLSPFEKLVFNPGEAEKAHEALSAFCYSIVPYFINKKHLITAYVLIHRALDLFFTSAAIRYDLIKVKRDHLEYYNVTITDENTPRIYLYKTYFEYVAKKDRLDFGSEETIRRINKKRNELLYCHGVDSVTQIDVSDAYVDAGKILKKKESWNVFKNIFTSKIRISIADVLESTYNLKAVITEYHLR